MSTSTEFKSSIFNSLGTPRVVVYTPSELHATVTKQILTLALCMQPLLVLTIMMLQLFVVSYIYIYIDDR